MAKMLWGCILGSSLAWLGWKLFE